MNTLPTSPFAGEPRALARRPATRRCAQASLALAAPLSAEDCQVQSMPDASPTKWHLAHITWFFETFVLERFEAGFVPFDPAFRVLFNSYYQGVGEQHPRPQRGLRHAARRWPRSSATAPTSTSACRRCSPRAPGDAEIADARRRSACTTSSSTRS